MTKNKNYKGGVSLERDAILFKKAKKNAPSNVKIVNENIYKYIPKENFNLVWDDTEHSGIDRWLDKVTNLIKNCAFVDDSVFVLTLDASMQRFLNYKNSIKEEYFLFSSEKT